MARVWYIENEEGTHAVIGEYSVCGMAFDELNGIETTSPIVTCNDCVDNIKEIRRVHTRRRTPRPPDSLNAGEKSAGKRVRKSKVIRPANSG